MTFKQMGCDPAEQTRRQDVCSRLNVLCYKRDHTEDPAKRRRIDRSIDVILRHERPWMKDIAFFLY